MLPFDAKGEILYFHTVMLLATAKSKMLGEQPPNCLGKNFRTMVTQFLLLPQRCFLVGGQTARFLWSFALAFLSELLALPFEDSF